MKILLIEDERQLAESLSQALAGSYTVEVAGDGETGLRKLSGHSYASILLDLNLPDMPGLEVCRQIRYQGFGGPIIVITGEAKVVHKIKLLDAGADDYLTKPFSLGELKARLRSLQRRSSQKPPTHNLQVGELSLDNATYSVIRGGQRIRLRRKEFSLLECLMQRAGTVVTREMLSNYSWRSSDEPWANTIDVHIKYLRDKVDRPFDKPLIRTVHGVGYKLEPVRNLKHRKEMV